MHFFERRKSQPVNPAAWRRYRVTQAHELRRRLKTVPAIAGALIVVSGITLVLRYPDYALGLAFVSALAAFALFAFTPLARVLPPRGILARGLPRPPVISGSPDEGRKHGSSLSGTIISWSWSSTTPSRIPSQESRVDASRMMRS